MIIYVVPEDWNDGTKGCSTDCAIARAVKRQTGLQVSVLGSGIYTENGVCIRQLKGDEYEFITRFDRGYTYEKFALEVHLPNHTPPIKELQEEKREYHFSLEPPKKSFEDLMEQLEPKENSGQHNERGPSRR